MNHFQAFRENSGLIDLRPVSSVGEIAVVIQQAHNLRHWFDRQRALESIAHRVGVDADLLARLAAEVPQ